MKELETEMRNELSFDLSREEERVRLRKLIAEKFPKLQHALGAKNAGWIIREFESAKKNGFPRDLNKDDLTPLYREMGGAEVDRHGRKKKNKLLSSKSSDEEISSEETKPLEKEMLWYTLTDEEDLKTVLGDRVYNAWMVLSRERSKSITYAHRVETGFDEPWKSEPNWDGFLRACLDPIRIEGEFEYRIDEGLTFANTVGSKWMTGTAGQFPSIPVTLKKKRIVKSAVKEGETSHASPMSVDNAGRVESNFPETHVDERIVKGGSVVDTNNSLPPVVLDRQEKGSDENTEQAEVTNNGKTLTVWSESEQRYKEIVLTDALEGVLHDSYGPGELTHEKMGADLVQERRDDSLKEDDSAVAGIPHNDKGSGKSIVIEGDVDNFSPDGSPVESQKIEAITWADLDNLDPRLRGLFIDYERHKFKYLDNREDLESEEKAEKTKETIYLVCDELRKEGRYITGLENLLLNIWRIFTEEEWRIFRESVRLRDAWDAREVVRLNYAEEKTEENRQVYNEAMKHYEEIWDEIERGIGMKNIVDNEIFVAEGRNSERLNAELNEAREAYAKDLENEDKKKAYLGALEAWNIESVNIARQAADLEVLKFAPVREGTDAETEKPMDWRNDFYEVARNAVPLLTRFGAKIGFSRAKRRIKDAEEMFRSDLEKRGTDTVGENFLAESLLRANAISEELKLQQVLMEKEYEEKGRIKKFLIDVARGYNDLPLGKKIAYGILFASTSAGVVSAAATGLLSAAGASFLLTSLTATRMGFGVIFSGVAGADAGEKRALKNFEFNKETRIQHTMNEDSFHADNLMQILENISNTRFNPEGAWHEELQEGRQRSRNSGRNKALLKSGAFVAAGFGAGFAAYKLGVWDAVKEYFLNNVEEIHVATDRVPALTKPSLGEAVPPPVRPPAAEVPSVSTEDVAAARLVPEPGSPVSPGDPSVFMRELESLQEVNKGETVWGKLEESANSFLHQEANSRQKTMFVDALKDILEKKSSPTLRAAGISSGDINLIRYDRDTIQFEKLFSKEDIESALHQAKISFDEVSRASVSAGAESIANVGEGVRTVTGEMTGPIMTEVPSITSRSPVSEVLSGKNGGAMSTEAVGVMNAWEENRMDPKVVAGTLGITSFAAAERFLGRGSGNRFLKLTLGLSGLSMKEIWAMRFRPASEVFSSEENRKSFAEKRMVRLVTKAYKDAFGIAVKLPAIKKSERAFSYMGRIVLEIMKKRTKKVS